MNSIIWMGRQRRLSGKGGQNKSASATGPPCAGMGLLSLRLAQEGEWVRIVAINGGKGIHERLAGVGLRIGAKIQILRNPMDGKLVIGHEGTRLYLGGGMVHKIQAIVIKGECE
jgi:ferrous iron transport protein A